MKKEIIKYLDYLWRDDKGNNTPEDVSWNIAIAKIKVFVELLEEPNIEKMIEDIDAKIEASKNKSKNCKSALTITLLENYINALQDTKEIIKTNSYIEHNEAFNKILELGK